MIYEKLYHYHKSFPEQKLYTFVIKLNIELKKHRSMNSILCGFLILLHFKGIKNIEKHPQCLTVWPVSYTHLDVYKRQLINVVSEQYSIYQIDKPAEEIVFMVCRLLPCHCELNPSELVWSQE